MSSKDSVTKDIAEGVAKAVIDSARESISKKVDEFVTKLKNRDIAFIEDIETIKTAKEMRLRPEFKFFKERIKNKDFRVLFQMGLTLRRFELLGKNPDRLIGKIMSKYDINGLHFAWMVQNEIFSKYIGIVLPKSPTLQILEATIMNLIENTDNTVMFINTDDSIRKKINEIVAKIFSNSPKVFIISGVGTAMGKCDKIKDGVMKKISGYTCESYGSKNKKIFFIRRIPVVTLEDEIEKIGKTSKG